MTIYKESWYREAISFEEERSKIQKEISQGLPGSQERWDIFLRRAKPKHVQLKEMVADAASKWKGLDWDGQVPALNDIPERYHISAVEEWIAHGTPSWADPEGAEGFDQRSNRRRHVGSLWEQFDEGDIPWEELEEAVGEYAKEEREAVQADAERAAQLGEAAVQSAFHGNWTEVVDYLKEAAEIELTYGDAPSWGPIEEYVEALLEEPESK